MSRRRRRARPDIAAAVAITITLLAIATVRWQIAAIGYGAWAITWAVSKTTWARLRRALKPRRYRWHDITLLEDIHPRTFPQDVKVAAAVRDGGMCQCQGCPACDWHRGYAAVCGSTSQIQFDHVRPWSLGGPSTLANCRTLCGPCNRAKGAKILP